MERQDPAVSKPQNKVDKPGSGGGDGWEAGGRGCLKLLTAGTLRGQRQLGGFRKDLVSPLCPLNLHV